MSNTLIAFLLAFVAISCNECLANYLKYDIEAESCMSPDFDPNIKLLNESSIQTSVILESSQLIGKTCAVRIIANQEIDGLIVTVQNLSIDNSRNGICDNFIEFNSSPVTKWCNSSDTETLIVPTTSLDIAFNFVSNDSHYFQLVVTPYKNSVNGQKCVTSAPFSCQSADQMICISDGFHCDGFDNCPNGSDENNCSIPSFPEIIDQDLVIEKETVESTDIPSSGSDYSIYNMKQFCNESVVKEIQLKLNSKDGNSPAILYLSNKESQSLRQMDCYVRFTIPSSNKNGLSIGIDSISIGGKNSSCDDFIQIRDSKSNLTKWCSNKTDKIGKSFSGTDYIDVLFHAGSQSNSSFSLIVTVIEEPTFFVLRYYCFSNANLKCAGSANECLNKKFKCDGHRNCPSGEDEVDCFQPLTTTTTTSTTTTTTSTTTTMTTKQPITTTTTRTTTTTKPTPSPHTSTPSPSSTAPAPARSPHHLSPGSIALIVISSIIGVVVGVLVIYMIIKRRRANVGYNALN